MKSVVVHPGAIEEAVRAPAARAAIGRSELGDLILPSRTLTALERIGIYHGMYLLRMRDALASDYPGLLHFLGEERFVELVRGYVEAHPSRSYTLNRLGDQLPEFISTAAGLRPRGFLQDLARLELGITQVFDAAETAPLSAEAIAAVPAEAWERARLRPIAAARVLAFKYPVSDYQQAVRNQTPTPPIGRRDTWVVIYRRNYAVYHLELSRRAHDLLQALAEGQPLAEAVAAAQRGRRGAGRAADELFRLFRDWIAVGLFQSVEY
jgi:hypothetical protein